MFLDEVPFAVENYQQMMEDDNRAIVPVNENLAAPGNVEQGDDELESLTSEDEAEIEGRNMGANGSRPENAQANPSGSVERAVTFNRSLPAVHAYLGRDLEDVGVGSQRVFDDNAIIEGIPLFPVPNLTLMPGQTLPLQSLHPRAISMFRAIIARSQMFGVITLNYNANGANRSEVLSKLGTLTQVLAYKEATDREVTSFKLRAVGRERFQVLETHRQIDGSLVAKIKVLPEIGVDWPLAAAEPPSLKRLRASGSQVRLQKRVGCKRDAKYLASAFTPWPWFVYKQYDIEEIIRQIKAELVEWYDPVRVEQLSKLPVDFSYWVAANLPLDNEMKLQLLSIGCVLQRLRFELSLIKKFTILVCRECSAKIGEKKHLFSMSLDGVIGAFVNPHGYVHETITLTEATSISESGLATTENSWFPGYAWTIANCSQCGDHLGWKFSARRRHLKPEEFYGISRAAILPSRETSSSTNDDEGRLPCM